MNEKHWNEHHKAESSDHNLIGNNIFRFNFKGAKYSTLFFIMILLGVVMIYYPSFNYKFNLDDRLSSGQNKWVQQGFAGIDDIFSEPYLDDEDARYGGFRPIPRFTHAIEYGIWGNMPNRAHIINVLLYLICCLLVFLFFKQSLFKNKLIGTPLLFALAIFAFHPLHVEAVASLKNREVLLAFIFGILMIFVFLKNDKKWYNYLTAFLLMMCCLYCKEDSIIYIAFLFLILLFERSARWKRDFLLIVLMVAIASAINYGVHQSFSSEINLAFTFDENPIINIKGSSKHISTVAYISLYLSRLVIIPNQQLFFYGTGKINLVGWDNIWVVTSVMFHLFFFIISLRLFYKKNFLGLLLMMYFACIGINSNLFVPVPGIIADRLMFLCIMPFAGIMVYLYIFIQEKWQNKILQYAYLFLLGFFITFSFLQSKNRVLCWESTYTLGQCDILELKNSINAQIIYVKFLKDEITTTEKAEDRAFLINHSLAHSRRILELNPQSIFALNYVGSIYCEYMDSIELGSKILLEGLKLDPDHPQILASLGNCFKEAGDTQNALKFYEASLKKANFNLNLRLEILAIHLKNKELRKAKIILDEMLRKSPKDKTTMIASGMWDIANGNALAGTKKFETVIAKHPEMTELKAMIDAFYKNQPNQP